MEFKEMSTGQAATSSSDVTATGAPVVNGNQLLVESGSMAAVVAPVDTVIGQPQSALTQLTSPSVEPFTAESAQPLAAIHTTLPPGPPVASSSNQPHDDVNRPCPPTDQLSHSLPSYIGQQMQQTGAPITADVQVSPGVQPVQQHLHPLQPQSEPLPCTLSQNLEPNLITAQPTEDLQQVVYPASTAGSDTQQPQQPAGAPVTQKQFPGEIAMTSAIPGLPVNAVLPPPPAASQQQHVNDIAPVGPQQPPDVVTSPAEPTLPTVESHHPPTTVLPQTAVAEQPTSVPAAELAVIEAAAAVSGHDAAQQLPDTVTDASQQQHVIDVAPVGPEQPPDVVSSPAEPAVPESQHLPAVAEQPSIVPAAESAMLEAAAAEFQRSPTVSLRDAAQQLPDTVTHVTDQQPVSVTAAPDDVQQNVVEPAQQQLPPIESTPFSAVQPPYSADVAAADLQQPCPPLVGEVVVTSIQPSGDLESLPAAVQHVQQTAAPSELPAPQAPPAATQVGESQQPEVIQVQEPIDAKAVQVGDNRQVEMLQVEQPTSPASSEQPWLNAAATSEPHVSAQVGESQRQEVIQVQEPTDVIADQQPQHEDVVKPTLNGVSDTHVSAGSDTDDAAEVISDSLSRDRDATNQHDHQHPSVSFHYLISSCRRRSSPIHHQCCEVILHIDILSIRSNKLIIIST